MIAFQTDLGVCGLTWSEAGITGVLMPGRRALENCATTDPGALEGVAREAAEGIVELMSGERIDLRHIRLDGTGIDDFRREVFGAALEIPAGETMTYGELAKAIGRPKGAREVGQALGRNPYPIIVPCHRILAAGGDLRGFSSPGGIETKRRMLEIEGAPGFAQVPLFA
jgi:methylated-DNA-[protein]-cysteine S-methyltransferase